MTSLATLIFDFHKDECSYYSDYDPDFVTSEKHPSTVLGQVIKGSH